MRLSETGLFDDDMTRDPRDKGRFQVPVPDRSRPEGPRPNLRLREFKSRRGVNQGDRGLVSTLAKSI